MSKRKCNISNEELLNLFNKCVSIEYVNCEHDADYALELVGDHLYIYFECSDSKTDWFHNFAFPAKPYKHMNTTWYAHRGFLKVWKVINDTIIDAVSDESIKGITIVGYSHGAALAAFAHECVWFEREDLRDNLNTYAFGAPRMYFGLMSKKMKKRWDTFYPIRNSIDIVTHVPPNILGFKHVNKVIKIKGKKYGPVNSHRPESYQTNLGGKNE